MESTPDYGRRLIATRIEELAQHEPERVWLSIPSSRPSDGFKDITWATGANAIDRAAWWMESTLGKGKEQSTLAYIGPQDMRYLVLLVAAIKAGYILFLTSPRNSVEDHVHLFKETHCRIVLHASTTKVDEILDRHPLHAVTVPELDVWLDTAPVPKYLYNAKYDDVAKMPYVIFHTSSSTGRPKPIYLPHSTACQSDNLHLIPSRDGRRTMFAHLKHSCERLLCPFPLFHAAGVGNCLAIAAYLPLTAVLAPADRIPNAGLIDELLDHGKCDMAVLPPSLLEDMSHSQASLERLGKLKGVFYGGGPISDDPGERLSRHVTLHNWLGSTEVGTVHSYVADKDAWQYFYFDPVYNGIDWRPTPEDDVYEMVFVRDPKLEQSQFVFKVFPNLQEFSPKDLYKKHPTKPHHWRHIGRVDDIIVFSNGEKLMPRVTEDLLSAHPAIRSALVVGHGRFNAAAILEPNEVPKTQREIESLLDDVWRTVVESNKMAPTHGMLSRSHLMSVSPDKPFLRAGKGTIRRGATIDLYSQEINKLYAEAASGVRDRSVTISVDSHTSLVDSLQLAILKIANLRLGPDDDFFNAGMNSLHVLNLSAVIRRSLSEGKPQADQSEITPKLIYANPNLNVLSTAILQLVNVNLRNGHGHARAETHQGIFQVLMDKYTIQATFSPTRTLETSHEGLTVLLTGSTGSLGSYILDILLADPMISRVYCLNRDPDSETRQTYLNTVKGLRTNFEKARFITVNLAKPLFDLDKDVYQAMLRSVNQIIHNQWQVDFNLCLSSFEPQIAGVRNLCEFAAFSSARSPIIFTSSVATVHNWPSTNASPALVSESSHANDLSYSTPGYGFSKLAAHKILEYAVENWGISVAILRVGQIAGPVTHGEHGMWSKQEWLPSILASSKHLGMLPEDIGGVVNWIPVDYCAQVVLELAKHTLDIAKSDAEGTRGRVSYYHVVNPHDAEWSDLLPVVQEYFDGKLQVVSLAEWVQALEQSTADDDNTKETGGGGSNPAVKLLGWLSDLVRQRAEGRGNVRLDTKETRKWSKGMRELEPVNEKWMELWLRQWRF